MLLISLSCWCGGKYSAKYSLGFSEESYQARGIQFSIMLRITVDQLLNTMKPIQDTIKASVPTISSRVVSVDNLRGTQREYSSKPLKLSIVKRILVFKR